MSEHPAVTVEYSREGAQWRVSLIMGESWPAFTTEWSPSKREVEVVATELGARLRDGSLTYAEEDK